MRGAPAAGTMAAGQSHRSGGNMTFIQVEQDARPLRKASPPVTRVRPGQPDLERSSRRPASGARRPPRRRGRTPDPRFRRPLREHLPEIHPGVAEARGVPCSLVEEQPISSSLTPLKSLKTSGGTASNGCLGTAPCHAVRRPGSGCRPIKRKWCEHRTAPGPVEQASTSRAKAPQTREPWGRRSSDSGNSRVQPPLTR